jgi:hypothetical protein
VEDDEEDDSDGFALPTTDFTKNHRNNLVRHHAMLGSSFPGSIGAHNAFNSTSRRILKAYAPEANTNVKLGVMKRLDGQGRSDQRFWSPTPQELGL